MSRSSIRLAVKARAWNPTQGEWTLAAQCVQPEEKERIGRFVFKKDAKSAMVGRLLIRHAVSSLLGIPYHAVKLARTEKSKPYVLSPTGEGSPHTGCHFNISHQGDFVVFAADQGREVGVDIMKVEWPRKTSVQEFFRLMERHLTEQEWSHIRNRSDDMEQLQVFYRYWCLKESVLKALGSGLGLELSRLDFHVADQDLRPGEVTCSSCLRMDGVPAQDWQFEETMLDNVHCLAVALQPPAPDQSTVAPQNGSGDSPPEKFTVWSIAELLSGCQPLPGSVPDQAYWENFAAKDEAPNLS